MKMFKHMGNLNKFTMNTYRPPAQFEVNIYLTCFFTYLSIYASFYPSINLSCYLDTNIWIHFEIVCTFFLITSACIINQSSVFFCGSFISFEVKFSYNEMNKSEVYDLRLANAYTHAAQIPDQLPSDHYHHHASSQPICNPIQRQPLF